MSQKRKAIRSCIGGALALTANIGLCYMFTVCLPYMAESFPDTPISMIALSSTVRCLLAFVCGFLLGPLMRKVSTRKLYLICAGLTTVYGLMNYFAPNVGIIIAAGLFGGFALGFGSQPASVAIISPFFEYFGSKRPLIIALVMTAGPLGTSSYSFASGALLKVLDWRETYLVMGLVTAAINLLVSFLLPKLSSEEKKVFAVKGESTENLPGLTTKEALKTPSFWMAFFGILFLAIMIHGLFGYLVAFLVDCGMPHSSAAATQGIMMLTGIAVVLLGGPIVRKVGLKGLILSLSIPFLFGNAMLALFFPKHVSMLLATLLAICCVVGQNSANISPNLTAELFGLKNFNQINPIITNAAFWAGAAISSQAVGTVVTKTGSYPTGLMVGEAFGAAATLLLFLSIAFGPMKKRKHMEQLSTDNKE